MGLCPDCERPWVPLPWEVEEDIHDGGKIALMIVDAEGEGALAVCVDEDAETHGRDELTATAHLMAHSPEMFEALVLARPILEALNAANSGKLNRRQVAEALAAVDSAMDAAKNGWVGPWERGE